MPVKTYDSKKVIVIVGGVPTTGYADGDFLTITPSSESVTKISGADGEVARSFSQDNTHEVTITLLQTSVSNNYLSGIASIDRRTGLGAVSLRVIDLSGATLFFWDAAWIRQMPDVTFSKEITDRAWVFDTAQAVAQFVGDRIIS